MAYFLVEMHFDEEFGLDHVVHPHHIPVMFAFVVLGFPLELFGDGRDDLIFGHWIGGGVLLRLMRIYLVLVLTLP